MKFKDAYYRQKNGFVNPKYTKDDWLRYKDKYYRWATSAKFQDAFGIETKPKHRHKRSIASRHEVRLFGRHLRPTWTVYTRPAKPIGRKKRGKWLYMPKRVLLRGNKNDKKPIFI